MVEFSRVSSLADCFMIKSLNCEMMLIKVIIDWLKKWNNFHSEELLEAVLVVSSVDWFTITKIHQLIEETSDPNLKMNL
jgi:hypothetical protein